MTFLKYWKKGGSNSERSRGIFSSEGAVLVIPNGVEESFECEVRCLGYARHDKVPGLGYEMFRLRSTSGSRFWNFFSSGDSEIFKTLKNNYLRRDVNGSLFTSIHKLSL